MIKTLKIKNLKSVRELSLDCRDLNLLVGDNLSGKSTVIDALRLMYLAARFQYRYKTDRAALINEGLVRHGREKAEASFVDTDGNFLSASLTGQDICCVDTSWQTLTDCFAGGNIYCIRTWEPAVPGCMKIPNDMRESLEGCGDIEMTVPGSFCLRYKDGLAKQVNDWLEKIIGSRIDFGEKYECCGAFFQNGTGSPKAAACAGLIAFCLSAPIGTVICIEYPETGLSPRAQSGLGRFLYHVADTGRQLFVETHSDHIFNAVRVGLVQKTMDADKIAVDYFVMKNGTTSCAPVLFNRYGDVYVTGKGNTIDGLFDQFSKDLDAMLGLID